MNPERHLKAHSTLYDNLVSGNDIAADTTKAFYDDYFAVLDLPAEFYLETVQIVFQEYRLARGTLEFRGLSGESRRRFDAPGCSPSRVTATHLQRRADGRCAGSVHGT